MILSILGFNTNKEIRFYRKYSDLIYNPDFIIDNYDRKDEITIRLLPDCNIIYHKYSNLIIGIVSDKKENILLMSNVIIRFVHGLNILLTKICEIDLLYSIDKVYEVLDGIICDGIILEMDVKKIAEFGVE